MSTSDRIFADRARQACSFGVIDGPREARVSRPQHSGSGPNGKRRRWATPPCLRGAPALHGESAARQIGPLPQSRSRPTQVARCRRDRAPGPHSLLDRPHVFIVHGHDDTARLEVTRFLEQAGFAAVLLSEQPNKGQTIVEKIEASPRIRFAVVLMTPDDECVKQGITTRRARRERDLGARILRRQARPRAHIGTEKRRRRDP